MLRLLIAILILSLAESECWKPIQFNPAQNYPVKNEGKAYRSSSYTEREDDIKSDLVINGDSSTSIRSGYSFPLGDTIVIELFETTMSYHNVFDIVIVDDKYLIRYSREINDSEFIQKFEPIHSQLELSSSDFSNGNKIRGHVEFIGKCVTGCSDQNRQLRIKGNFSVKIHRY
jgi:hypothetical protein